LSHKDGEKLFKRMLDLTNEYYGAKDVDLGVSSSKKKEKR